MFAYCNNPVTNKDYQGSIPGRNDMVFMEDGAGGGSYHVGMISSDDYQKYEELSNITIIDRKRAFDESEPGKLYNATDTLRSGIETIAEGFKKILVPEPTLFMDLYGVAQITYGVVQTVWGGTKIAIWSEGWIDDEEDNN